MRFYAERPGRLLRQLLADVLVSAWVVLAAPPMVLLWLTLRVRYARAARSAITARVADTDLLALRALAHMPVRRLLAVSDDRDAVWGLAEPDELRSLGLRPPRPGSTRKQ